MGQDVSPDDLSEENRDIQILKEASLDSNLQIIRNNLYLLTKLYIF